MAQTRPKGNTFREDRKPLETNTLPRAAPAQGESEADLS